MQRQDSSLAGPFGHVVKFTERAVSGWGGFAAVGGYFERIGVRGVLAQALPDGRTSPNQIAVADMAMGLFGTVLTGGRRFSHAERVRGDEVIKRSLGMERQPSGMTLTRYFGGLVAGQVQRLVEVLGSFVLGRVPGVSGGGTLDLDSTVIPRFGQQEGSLKGHNPQKHGRPSHHPLLAMLAEAKLIVHAWMRSGNTGTARGVEALLEEVLARLPGGLTISRIRADSGFFIASFFEALESKGLSYAVAVRMTAPVKRAVVGLSGWKDIGSGLEVAETKYETYGWKKARRLVVVRELLRVKPDARGRRLFELPDYTFHAVVTDLTLSPQDVWRFYNKPYFPHIGPAFMVDLSDDLSMGCSIRV